MKYISNRSISLTKVLKCQKIFKGLQISRFLLLWTVTMIFTLALGHQNTVLAFRRDLLAYSLRYTFIEIFSKIMWDQTKIVRVEGEHADLLTILTYHLYVVYQFAPPLNELLPLKMLTPLSRCSFHVKVNRKR